MEYGNLAYKYDSRERPVKPAVRNNRSVRGTRTYTKGNKSPSMARSQSMVRGTQVRGTAAVKRYDTVSDIGTIRNVSRKYVKDSREQMLYRKKTLVRVCYMVLAAAAASFMITKFVAVYETNQEIKKLEAQVESMQSATSQKIFEMEQSVDLANLEQEAKNRLGMQRPEKYQTVYVDVKQEDVTEVTAGEVEGFTHSVAKWFGKIKKHIVETFSIK